MTLIKTIAKIPEAKNICAWLGKLADGRCFFDCSEGHIERVCFVVWEITGRTHVEKLIMEPWAQHFSSLNLCEHLCSLDLSVPWLIPLPTTVPDYFDTGPLHCLFWWMAQFCYCSLLRGGICSAVGTSAVGTSPGFSIRCARVWLLDQPGIRHTLWEQASAILDSNTETVLPRVIIIIWQALEKHLIFFSIPISFILHSHFFFSF